MHPADCPSWDYARHLHASSVGIRCELILHTLGKKELPIDGSLRNTRPLHHQMFVGLTPDKCPYYAGNYRGESFRCLRHMRVKVEADSRVGVPPKRVAPELANFVAYILNAGLKALDDAFLIPDERLSPAEKLNYVVVFASRVLVEFLRIHPYANGNGHTGRLIVWLILARFGYWPKQWPLDARPPYSELLSRFRDGDRAPLERFMLNAINGTTP